MSQPATFACSALLGRTRSEAHPGLYNPGTSPAQTRVLMTCESYFQVTEGLQWFYGFISRVAALLHSSPLCFVRLWWAASSAPPVTHFHFHSPFPDTFSITARLSRHLCLPPANGIKKKTTLRPEDEEPLRQTQQALCIWPTSASHPVQIHFTARSKV